MKAKNNDVNLREQFKFYHCCKERSNLVAILIRYACFVMHSDEVAALVPRSQ